MSNFCEMVEMEVRKHFKLLQHKHIVHHFEACDLETPNLFREISKFREDISNNEFHEIRKCFRKTAKFDYFTKQIMPLEKRLPRGGRFRRREWSPEYTSA